MADFYVSFDSNSKEFSDSIKTNLQAAEAIVDSFDNHLKGLSGFSESLAAQLKAMQQAGIKVDVETSSKGVYADMQKFGGHVEALNAAVRTFTVAVEHLPGRVDKMVGSEIEKHVKRSEQAAQQRGQGGQLGTVDKPHMTEAPRPAPDTKPANIQSANIDEAAFRGLVKAVGEGTQATKKVRKSVDDVKAAIDTLAKSLSGGGAAAGVTVGPDIVQALSGATGAAVAAALRAGPPGAPGAAASASVAAPTSIATAPVAPQPTSKKPRQLSGVLARIQQVTAQLADAERTDEADQDALVVELEELQEQSARLQMSKKQRAARDKAWTRVRAEKSPAEDLGNIQAAIDIAGGRNPEYEQALLARKSTSREGLARVQDPVQAMRSIIGSFQKAGVDPTSANLSEDVMKSWLNVWNVGAGTWKRDTNKPDLMKVIKGLGEMVIGSKIEPGKDATPEQATLASQVNKYRQRPGVIPSQLSPEMRRIIAELGVGEPPPNVRDAFGILGRNAARGGSQRLGIGSALQLERPALAEEAAKVRDEFEAAGRELEAVTQDLTAARAELAKTTRISQHPAGSAPGKRDALDAKRAAQERKVSQAEDRYIEAQARRGRAAERQQAISVERQGEAYVGQARSTVMTYLDDIGARALNAASISMDTGKAPGPDQPLVNPYFRVEGNDEEAVVANRALARLRSVFDVLDQYPLLMREAEQLVEEAKQLRSQGKEQRALGKEQEAEALRRQAEPFRMEGRNDDWRNANFAALDARREGRAVFASAREDAERRQLDRAAARQGVQNLAVQPLGYFGAAGRRQALAPTLPGLRVDDQGQFQIQDQYAALIKTTAERDARRVARTEGRKVTPTDVRSAESRLTSGLNKARANLEKFIATGEEVQLPPKLVDALERFAAVASKIQAGKQLSVEEDQLRLAMSRVSGVDDISGLIGSQGADATMQQVTKGVMHGHLQSRLFSEYVKTMGPRGLGLVKGEELGFETFRDLGAPMTLPMQTMRSVRQQNWEEQEKRLRDAGNEELLRRRALGLENPKSLDELMKVEAPELIKPREGQVAVTGAAAVKRMTERLREYGVVFDKKINPQLLNASLQGPDELFAAFKELRDTGELEVSSIRDSMNRATRQFKPETGVVYSDAAVAAAAGGPNAGWWNIEARRNEYDRRRRMAAVASATMTQPSADLRQARASSAKLRQLSDPEMLRGFHETNVALRQDVATRQAQADDMQRKVDLDEARVAAMPTTKHRRTRRSAERGLRRKQAQLERLRADAKSAQEELTKREAALEKHISDYFSTLEDAEFFSALAKEGGARPRGVAPGGAGAKAGPPSVQIGHLEMQRDFARSRLKELRAKAGASDEADPLWGHGGKAAEQAHGVAQKAKRAWVAQDASDAGEQQVATALKHYADALEHRARAFEKQQAAKEQLPEAEKHLDEINEELTALRPPKGAPAPRPTFSDLQKQLAAAGGANAGTPQAEAIKKQIAEMMEQRGEALAHLQAERFDREAAKQQTQTIHGPTRIGTLNEVRKAQDDYRAGMRQVQVAEQETAAATEAATEALQGKAQATQQATAATQQATAATGTDKERERLQGLDPDVLRRSAASSRGQLRKKGLGKDLDVEAQALDRSIKEITDALGGLGPSHPERPQLQQTLGQLRSGRASIDAVRLRESVAAERGIDLTAPRGSGTPAPATVATGSAVFSGRKLDTDDDVAAINRVTAAINKVYALLKQGIRTTSTTSAADKAPTTQVAAQAQAPTSGGRDEWAEAGNSAVAPGTRTIKRRKPTFTPAGRERLIEGLDEAPKFGGRAGLATEAREAIRLKAQHQALAVSVEAVAAGMATAKQASQLFGDAMEMETAQVRALETQINQELNTRRALDKQKRRDEELVAKETKAKGAQATARTMAGARLTLSSETVEAGRRIGRSMASGIGASDPEVAAAIQQLYARVDEEMRTAGANTGGVRKQFKNLLTVSGIDLPDSEVRNMSRMLNAGDMAKANEPQARVAGRQVGGYFGASMADGFQGGLSRMFGAHGFWSRVVNSAGLFVVRNFAAGMVFGLTNALKDVISTALEAESTFIRVSHALEATGTSVGNLRTGLLQISTDYGVALGDVYESAAGLVGVFDDVQDLEAGTRIVTQLQMISNGALSAKEGMGALASAASAFGFYSVDSLQHVADALTVVQTKLGVNVEIGAEGLGAFAGQAKSLGLGMEESLVYVSQIAKMTNATGAAAGEQFGRILAVLQTGRGQKVLEDAFGDSMGVALGDRDYSSALKTLMGGYKDLDKQQQEQIATVLGGQRQMRALQALLLDGSKVLATITAAEEAFGDATERSDAIAGQFNVQLKILRTNLQGIGEGLVRAGLLDFAAITLTTLNGLLQETGRWMSQMLDFVERIPMVDTLRHWIAGIVGLRIAMGLLKGVAQSLVGTMGTMNKFVLGQGGRAGLISGAAGVVGAAGAAGAAGGAAPAAIPSRYEQRMQQAIIAGRAPGLAARTPFLGMYRAGRSEEFRAWQREAGITSPPPMLAGRAGAFADRAAQVRATRMLAIATAADPAVAAAAFQASSKVTSLASIQRLIAQGGAGTGRVIDRSDAVSRYLRESGRQSAVGMMMASSVDARVARQVRLQDASAAAFAAVRQQGLGDAEASRAAASRAPGSARIVNRLQAVEGYLSAQARQSAVPTMLAQSWSARQSMPSMPLIMGASTTPIGSPAPTGFGGVAAQVKAGLEAADASKALARMEANATRMTRALNAAGRATQFLSNNIGLLSIAAVAVGFVLSAVMENANRQKRIMEELRAQVRRSDERRFGKPDATKTAEDEDKARFDEANTGMSKLGFSVSTFFGAISQVAPWDIPKYVSRERDKHYGVLPDEMQDEIDQLWESLREQWRHALDNEGATGNPNPGGPPVELPEIEERIRILNDDALKQLEDALKKAIENNDLLPDDEKASPAQIETYKRRLEVLQAWMDEQTRATLEAIKGIDIMTTDEINKLLSLANQLTSVDSRVLSNIVTTPTGSTTTSSVLQKLVEREGFEETGLMAAAMPFLKGERLEKLYGDAKDALDQATLNLEVALAGADEEKIEEAANAVFAAGQFYTQILQTKLDDAVNALTSGAELDLFAGNFQAAADAFAGAAAKLDEEAGSLVLDPAASNALKLQAQQKRQSAARALIAGESQQLNLQRAQSRNQVTLAQLEVQLAQVELRHAGDSVEMRNSALIHLATAQKSLQDAYIAQGEAARQTRAARVPPGDAVRQAQMAKSNARAAMRDASIYGTASTQYQSALQQSIQAGWQIIQAQRAVVAARIQYRQTQATVAGHTVKAAEIGIQLAKAQLATAKKLSGGRSSAEVIQARAGVLEAQAALRDTKLQYELETIDFNKEMGKITGQEAVKALQAMLKATNLTEQQRRQIMLKIKGLQDDIRNQLTGSGFNIPGEIKMPTAYEVRRSLGADAARQAIETSVMDVRRMQDALSGSPLGAQSSDAALVAAMESVRDAVLATGAQQVTQNVDIVNQVPTAAIAKSLVAQVVNELKRQASAASRSNTSTPRTVP